MRGERREERMLDGGHDDADDAGLAVIEVAGELIGHIVEFAHRLLDLVAHVLRHIAGAVDDERDAAQRDSRFLCDIAHADHMCLLAVVLRGRTGFIVCAAAMCANRRPVCACGRGAWRLLVTGW